jgi:PKD repeat protein
MKKPISRKMYLCIVLALFGTISAFSQCVANFSYSLGSNGAVTFVSTSTGTTANTMYTWQTDGGSVTTPNSTYSYTYTNNQWYTMYLQIADSSSSPGCTAWHADTLGIGNAPCNANVSLSHNVGVNGNVSFNATHYAGYTYFWAYGDGFTTAGNSSMMHTYNANGVYVATVTVTSYSGTCTYTATQTVSVTIVPCLLNASFTYTVGSNGQVNFQSTSTGTSNTTLYQWYFGDNTQAYGNPISHTYQSNASFYVSLYLTDSLGTGPASQCFDSTSQQVTITTFTCLANSNFSISKDSSQNLHWFIWPTFPQNVSAVSWNWGDGSSSSLMYPSHTFSAAGIYNICLSVTVSCGATYSTCTAANIYKPANSSEQQMVSVTVVDPTSTTAIKKYQGDKLDFKVLPNPNNGFFTLTGNNPGKDMAEIHISNILGQSVYDGVISSKEGQINEKINLEHLPAGTYFIKLSIGNETEFTRLVIAR